MVSLDDQKQLNYQQIEDFQNEKCKINRKSRKLNVELSELFSEFHTLVSDRNWFPSHFHLSCLMHSS